MLISKKMRYFIVIMESGNFTKAADILCITRSPLSKMISELERSLQDVLFIRRHNDLEPTKLAWDIYHKCKPLYNRLLLLNDDFYKRKNEKPYSFYFDATIPENLYNCIKMIFHSEERNALFHRELASPDSIFDLQNSRGQCIVSYRDLGNCVGVRKDLWEGGEIVLLKPENAHDDFNKIFIKKDNHTSFLKERFQYAFKDTIKNPEFIEHNHEIFTLLHMVRKGKGHMLFNDKLCAMHKLDRINILPLSNYHTKCYLYYNERDEKNKLFIEFKKCLNQFI